VNRASALRAALVVSVGLAAAAAGFWLGAPRVDAARALPQGALPDLDGRMRELKEWAGTPLVINFWATWCPPCREELPLLVSAQRRYAGRVQLIGVAIDQRAAVERFVAELPLNYPQLIGLDAGLSWSAALGNGPGSLPYTVFVNAEGKITHTKLGGLGERELEELLRPILLPPRPALSPALPKT